MTGRDDDDGAWPGPEPARPGALARRLGTADAVLIGMGSMIGAGIFAALAPAAAAAGSALVLGVLVAAALAYANATSTAQLAAAYPVSGGAYAYGRARLGPWWGYAAGWCFVVGKTASCAAMALTFAAYVAPPAAQRPLAALAVVGLVAINTRGITRTAQATRVLVAVTLAVLGAVVVVACAHVGADDGAPGHAAVLPSGGTPYGVAQAASVMFFAFAGYARIATLGEEVKDPRTVIPRAIQVALGAVVAIYLVVAVAALAVLGPDALARSTAPLADAVTVAEAAWLVPVVRVGAAVAALGALLGLVAGVGRTALAMARERDLPRWLALVDPVRHVPQRAEVAVGAVVVLVVLVADVRGAIGFSSFAVLLYYAVANTAALTQTGADRRWPRAVQGAGLAGCVGLAATVPMGSLVAGVAVLAVGLALRTASRRRPSGAARSR